MWQFVTKKNDIILSLPDIIMNTQYV